MACPRCSTSVGLPFSFQVILLTAMCIPLVVECPPLPWLRVVAGDRDGEVSKMWTRDRISAELERRKVTIS